MKILFFTGTGNSLWVAKELGGELLSIPKLEQEKRYEIESDIIGIVCPIYAGNIPRFVQQYLSKAKLKADYVFAIFTCGYGSGAAAHTTKKILAKNGIRLDYAANLLMLDNYLLAFDIENELRKLPDKNVEKNFEQIKEDIGMRKRNVPQISIFSRFLVAVFGFLKPSSEVRKKFCVSSDCVGCGLCSKLCPTGNITVSDKPEWGNNCTGCLSCAQNCPKAAIRLNGERGTARYRHPDVTVAELIKFNGAQ